jgi:hypothetical protein
VLGGAVIQEVSNTGQKNVGYVYASRQLLATQKVNYVTWKHPSPAGVSEFYTFNFDGYGSTQFDPLGANLPGQYTPPPEYEEGPGDIGAGHFAGILDARWSDYLNTSAGCMVDNVETSCNMAMVAVNLRAGEDGGTVHCAGVRCGPFGSTPSDRDHGGSQPGTGGKFSMFGRGYLMKTIPGGTVGEVDIKISFEEILTTYGLFLTANGTMIPLMRSLERPQNSGQIKRVTECQMFANIVAGIAATSRSPADFVNKLWFQSTLRLN